MSFEILESPQQTVYAPLNTTIDADRDYYSLTGLDACACGGGGIKTRIQMGTGPHSKDNGGTRLLLVFGEHPLFRNNQMHPHLLDRCHALDGLGQFPFDRPLIIDLLDELRHADVRLIEQLIPCGIRHWNALGSQVHA